MSRSEPSIAQNPMTRRFEYSAKHGEVRYFDKTKGEKGENVTVTMPFRFLYLDDVYQAGGGKKVGRPPKQEFIGYFSNAVKDLKKDVLTVRNRDGIVTEGLYADVKKEAGVKLIVGLYIAFHDENKELQIGYLKLKGSSMGEWWDFCKGKNIETGVITLSRGEEMKDEDGRVYYLPAFTYGTNITDETNERAVELDRELQKYLKSYFAPRNEQPEQAYAATANSQQFSGDPDFGPETDFSEPDDIDAAF